MRTLSLNGNEVVKDSKGRGSEGEEPKESLSLLKPALALAFFIPPRPVFFRRIMDT